MAPQGLFIVAAAAWVTDRIADHKRIGEAQVIVGSSLVAGSAIGPTLAGLVIESVGYRGMFWLLAAVGAIASAIVVIAIPEAKRDTIRVRLTPAVPLRRMNHERHG